MKRNLLVFISLILFIGNIFAQQSTIYEINIDSEINATSRIFLNKGLNEANELNVDAVLIRLNTYGGTLVDADSMRTAILYNPIPVYVFIDNNAASAGALISIACEKIFMRPGATIGAATVVQGDSGDEAPDKYQSYMRGMMRATAEKTGRDPKIAEAMVDERVNIPEINEEGRVLTLTAQEAMKVGYCDGIAETKQEVIEQLLDIKDYKIVEYTPSIVDKLMGFLTNHAFRAILIMIIVAGIYFELQSPGIGFPTMAAITAAVLYFTPLYLEGLVQNWEIAVFIIGILLILIELFVTPGMGVAGISGIVLIGMGLVFAMLNNDWFSFREVTIPDLSYSLITVSSGILLAIFLILYMSARIGKKGMFRKIALETDLSTSESVTEEELQLVGKEGTAMTDLRPSGKIIIAGEVYDAVSNLGYIEAGTKIKAIRLENMQLYVDKL
ncbi:nodulation protein NfeD [Bacteroidales bacterium OttesenSCG-928-M11]|nr:nodulation protein NfeD [Bacteroidales bacterium OttesenSCG-928-M11]